MKTILIIDDNQAHRNNYAEFLGRNGYRVLQAGDGNTGIELFKERQADLVITDIMMDGKDGIEVIIELTGQYPGLKIIAVSGGDRTGYEYLADAALLGAMTVIPKPVAFDRLLTQVKQLLENGQP